MSDEKLTPGDIAQHIEGVRKALDGSGAMDLVRMVNRLSAQSWATRLPFALVGLPNERGDVLMQDTCQVPCRFTHFVLSPETARAYVLRGFFLGVDMQAAGGSLRPLPLETFSIEYMQDDRLAACQAWKTTTCDPGMHWTVDAVLRPEVDAAAGPAFRGLLWAEFLRP